MASATQAGCVTAEMANRLTKIGTEIIPTNLTLPIVVGEYDTIFTKSITLQKGLYIVVGYLTFNALEKIDKALITFKFGATFTSMTSNSILSNYAYNVGDTTIGNATAVFTISSARALTLSVRIPGYVNKFELQSATVTIYQFT